MAGVTPLAKSLAGASGWWRAETLAGALARWVVFDCDRGTVSAVNAGPPLLLLLCWVLGRGERERAGLRV